MVDISYPEARRDDVVETMGGVEFADPYRWLEDDASEDVATWQKTQSDLAERTIRAWPGYDALTDAVTRFTVDSRLAAPRRHGDRWFRTVVADPADEQPVLMMSDSPAGDGRVLVDPNALSVDAGAPVGLDWYTPSPDGSHVAYGLSVGGDEQSVLHVVETETGRVLDDRIPHMTLGVVAWLPDSTGFYCNAGLVAPTETFARQIVFHRLGDGPPTEPEPVDLTAFPLPAVQVSGDGRYAAIVIGNYKLRPGWVRDLTGEGAWEPFLLDVEGTCLGEFLDDRYVAATTHGAPRGRVVAIPIESPTDQTTWEELVPESDAVIRNVSVAGGLIVTHELVDALPRFRVFDPDGTPRGTVPLPGPGSVSVDAKLPAAVPFTPMLQTGAGVDDITFVYSAVDTAPSVFRCDVKTLELEQLTPPARSVDGFVTRQIFVDGDDGTRIPVTIVHRGDIDASVPQPTMISAYGGFNVAFFPGYHAHLLPFLQAGGIYALAALRGGGEYGERWWDDGRLANKQHTFDDLYAVARHLVESGVSTVEKLGLVGGSNGGLLTGVAATQRPELFGAIVSLIPVYDLFRGVKDPLTGFVLVNEYGNPMDPEQAQWLAGYSPVQNAPESAELPPIFIGAGEKDMRCPPWHARKLAAALQHAQTGSAPILLHVQADAGHGPGKPSSVMIANAVTWMAFLMSAIGLEVSPDSG